MHISGIRLHVRGLLFEKGTGLWAHQRHVEGVNNDEGDQQRKDLVDEFGGKVAFHGCSIPMR